jgi:hypothetical protein
MNVEFGLFVIWSEADHLRSRVLTALADHFEIRGVHRIAWSADLVSENFGRFYRSSRLIPPYHTYFQRQKGSGTFTLITVLDHNPVYANRPTNKGLRLVNSRMFDAKREFRGMTDHRMVVHSTETSEEATRDLYMLMGVSPEEYLQHHPAAWAGATEHCARDVTGAKDWPSLRDAFDALNHLVSYVVLRNFEGLPESHVVGEHDDVDLLVEDYQEAIRILNARPVLGLVPQWGGRFHVSVSGRQILFDIRFVGDDYFDEQWQKEILERRRFSESRIFVPCDRDYFETLAYHAVAHKRELSHDYSVRLTAMAASQGRTDWTPDRLASSAETRRLLDTVVRDQGRRHIKPKDVTVFYNFAAVGLNWARSRQRLAGLRRKGATRWWRLKSSVIRMGMQARYGVVQRFPALRRLRRPLQMNAPSGQGMHR